MLFMFSTYFISNGDTNDDTNSSPNSSANSSANSNTNPRYIQFLSYT